jgi:hypothetical protein
VCPPEEAPFQILILYENKASLGYARALEAALAQGCLSEVEIKSSDWNFSVLSHPRLREHAERAAREADLIVISAGERTVLPLHVQSWMRNCLAGKRKLPTALVALLKGQSAFDSPTLPLDHSLRRMAEKSGVDFFATKDYRA